MKLDQIAINTVSTTQNSLEEALAAYAQAGFRNIEFVLPLAKDWLKQGHSVAELRQLLEQHQLRPIGGFETHLVCFGAEEEKQANHALLVSNARLIAELGGGAMVVGTDGPQRGSLEALAVVAQNLREVAERIEGLPVNIALEFNWSPIVKSVLSARLVVEQVNHPQVGILFDPAHYHTTSSKFEHLDAETISWIKHCHFNDMRHKPGDLSDCNADRVLPGSGMLDLAALIGVLERHGYAGYYAIEMFNEDLWKLPADEAARQCYQSMLAYCQQ